MNRRHLLTLLAASPFLAACPLLAARSRIGKNRVSAVTDEIAATQSDALAFAKRFNLQWIELRSVPGTKPGIKKEFASLTAPELKRYAAELGENKLKVSVLHAASPTPEAIGAARTLGAVKLLVPAGILLVAAPEAPTGIDWDPDKVPEQPPKGSVLNVRIPSLVERNWRRVLESLEKDNYQGEICLETAPDKADDAMRELMHFIGEL